MSVGPVLVKGDFRSSKNWLIQCTEFRVKFHLAFTLFPNSAFGPSDGHRSIGNNPTELFFSENEIFFWRGPYFTKPRPSSFPRPADPNSWGLPGPERRCFIRPSKHGILTSPFSPHPRPLVMRKRRSAAAFFFCNNRALCPFSTAPNPPPARRPPLRRKKKKKCSHRRGRRGGGGSRDDDDDCEQRGGARRACSTSCCFFQGCRAREPTSRATPPPLLQCRLHKHGEGGTRRRRPKADSIQHLELPLATVIHHFHPPVASVVGPLGKCFTL
jgi:hypothetical protein